MTAPSSFPESGRRPPRAIVALLVVAVLLLGATLARTATAQELTPRSFWPAPVGTRLLIFGYSHTAGDVLTDPSIPIYGVNSKIDTGLVAYYQAFDLWGRTANFQFEAPYSRGTTQGVLDDTPARRDFSGFNDIGVTLTVNLLGAPALSYQDFQALRADPRPLLGISVKLVPPTGQYEKNRFINVGSNRWATRVKLGSVIPLNRKWLLELDAGAWFFGPNDDFVTGKREQDPIYALEAHLVRRFSPGFWASLEYNYYTGGRQRVAGQPLDNLQDNSRIGSTVVVPYGGRYAVKVGYSVSMRTRYGVDSDQFLLTWQTLLP